LRILARLLQCIWTRRFCLENELIVALVVIAVIGWGVLIAPARWCGLDGRKLFAVQREDIDMSFGCTPDFTRRSVGYVGCSDGWQDLMDNFKMDWEFEQAEDGNIALMGEIDLSDGMGSRWALASGALSTVLQPTSCKRSPLLSPTSVRSM
jgi:hypothetical protein